MPKCARRHAKMRPSTCQKWRFFFFAMGFVYCCRRVVSYWCWIVCPPSRGSWLHLSPIILLLGFCVRLPDGFDSQSTSPWMVCPPSAVLHFFTEQSTCTKTNFQGFPKFMAGPYFKANPKKHQKTIWCFWRGSLPQQILETSRIFWHTEIPHNIPRFWRSSLLKQTQENNRFFFWRRSLWQKR